MEFSKLKMIVESNRNEIHLYSSCEILSPCGSSPCQSGTCHNVNSTTFQCACQPGFTGIEKKNFLL
jgi:hypothetical protein